MDPNAGKKGMYNKLNKEQALQKLESEKFNRRTVSFYRYVIVKNPEKLRDTLYSEWSDLGVLGRIYLAKEGINAQLSIPEHNWSEFTLRLNSYAYFKDIPFKIAV